MLLKVFFGIEIFLLAIAIEKENHMRWPHYFFPLFSTLFLSLYCETCTTANEETKDAWKKYIIKMGKNTVHAFIG